MEVALLLHCFIEMRSQRGTFFLFSFNFNSVSFMCFLIIYIAQLLCVDGCLKCWGDQVKQMLRTRSFHVVCVRLRAEKQIFDIDVTFLPNLR